MVPVIGFEPTKPLAYKAIALPIELHRHLPLILKLAPTIGFEPMRRERPNCLANNPLNHLSMSAYWHPQRDSNPQCLVRSQIVFPLAYEGKLLAPAVGVEPTPMVLETTVLPLN